MGAKSLLHQLMPVTWGLAAIAMAGCGGRRTPPSGTAPTVAAPNRKYLLEPPAWFSAAVTRGTRTPTGQPGPKYWQQWAEYRLDAEINPTTKRLTGQGTATYYNRSPDTLRSVYVHLYANIFAPNAKHNTDVPWALEGLTLTKLTAQGETRAAGSGYTIDGTAMKVDLPKPLPPGGSADFEFGWRIRVPPDGVPRGGQNGDVWYLSYWYPQFAVYDDLSGWQIDPYFGNAEFYMGYGKYDVAITVPAGWLVDATGTLQNPSEVLSAQTRARLDSAARTSGVVRIVGDSDRVAGRSTAAGTGGKLTWRFRADSVRDVSWAASANYLWDATRALTGADTAAIYAFYRPEQRRSFWDRNARYGQHAIEFYSRYLWPYPYPKMSAIDGPKSCGGMEFPMMTCIGGDWDSLRLYEVTTHEIAHMWFPMVVGSDEKRYAWMDEGLTQFNQSQAIPDLFKSVDDEEENRNGYLRYTTRRGNETELMRHGDRYPDYPSYGIASYFKPATVLVALRGVLGDSVFHRAFREYGRRWRFKHPSPYDLFNTFEDAAGKDLDWFWRTWFFETWTLDQAIEKVTVTADSVDIVIQNRGDAPMPVVVEVKRAEGAPERHTLPVDVWLTGARRTTLRVARMPTIKGITIDPEQLFPDVDRDNQLWPR